MHRLTILAILICLCGCRSPQGAMHRLEQSSPGFSASIQPALVTPPAQEAGSIENYVQLGLARNPAVAEARHRIESLRHRIPQELSLPDPRVNTTTHLSPVETAAGRQAFALGVSQKFVNSQRLATKAAIALEDVRAACLLYTSPSPRDATLSRMPSSA